MKRPPVSKALRLTLRAAPFAALCLALAGPIQAEEESEKPAEPPYEAIGARVKALFEQSKGAVVRVTADDFHGELAGTGFFVNPNGTVFTAYSVAGESWNVVVEIGEKKYPAVRVLADERSGLAVLKIATTKDFKTPFLPMGKVAELTLASAIFSIGYPLNHSATPNVGFLAGFDQKFGGQYLSTTHLRANLPVNRGEQGSPLLNLRGEVVGMLVARMDDGKGTCYALPIHAARKVFRDYERFGVARPGWVGVEVFAPGRSFDKEGTPAVVKRLIDGAPATQAGLKEGDIVLEVAGIALKRPSDMIDISFFLTAGEKVALKVQRGESIVTLDVVSVDNPLAPPPAQLNLLMEMEREGIRSQIELNPLPPVVEGDGQDEKGNRTRLKLQATP